MAITKVVRSLKSGKKSIRYRATVYGAGVILASRSFPTSSAAHQWHDRSKRKIAKGYVLSITFGECFSDYMAGPFLRLRRSTMQAKKPRIKYLSDCPLSSILLDDLAPAHISAWLRWLSDQPMGHRRESFHEELMFLNTVLTWFQETQDPSFVVPILKRHRTDEIYFKELTPRRPDYYMKPEEVRAWLLALSEGNPTYYYLGLLMVHTGLRVGEAAGLCWDAVNLDGPRPTLKVIRTLAWDTKHGYFQEQAKNESSIRMMKIPTVIVQKLRELKAKGVTTYLDELGVTRQPLFVDSKARPLPYSRVRYHFNKAFDDAGLDWSGSHITRHTFATLSLQVTRDLTGVQATMGHSSSAQTQAYAKIIALEFGDGLERTADLIGEENRTLFHTLEGVGTKNPLKLQGVK